ncbi:MAG: hypothetical protein KDK39_06395 [Leptospiraceae bacterium]|nr:hypothetical protein [Leptospiraceae bacterium]
MSSGIQFQSTPPLHISMRFYGIAPLFLLLIAILIYNHKLQVQNLHWHSDWIVIAHLFVLGFILNHIYGSIFQLLPVLGAQTPKNVNQWSTPLWFLHNGGLSVFILAWLLNNKLLLWAGAASLFSAFLVYALFIVLSLKSLIRRSHIHNALLDSLGALFMGLVWAGFLVLGHAGNHFVLDRSVALGWHLRSLVVVWLVISIHAISLQVLPMFFVSHPLPEWWQRRASRLLLALLLCSTISSAFTELGGYQNLKDLVFNIFTFSVATWVCLFTGLNLRALLHRTKKNPDISLNLWLFGFGLAGLLALIWLINSLPGSYLQLLSWGYGRLEAILTGVWLLIWGGIIIQAMIRKIIPFLIWQQLMQTGSKPLPIMGRIFHRYLDSLSGFSVSVLALFYLISPPDWEERGWIIATLLLFWSLSHSANLLRSAWVYYQAISREAPISPTNHSSSIT